MLHACVPLTGLPSALQTRDPDARRATHITHLDLVAFPSLYQVLEAARSRPLLYP